MKNVRMAKYGYILISLLTIILGCLFIIWPGIPLEVILRIMGVLITGGGLVKLYGYFSDDLFRIAFQFDLALGILTTVFGLVVIAFPHIISGIFTAAIAVFIIINGVFTVQNAVEARSFGIKGWWWLLLGGIFSVAVSVLMLTNPFKSAEALMRLLGAALVFDGIQNLITAVITIHSRNKNDN